MNVGEPEFQAHIEPEELETIRSAIRAWGKSESIVQSFFGARLGDYLSQWKQFVNTDWENWDISEYDHDLACRYWLQLIFENVGEASKRRISADLEPIDRIFKSKMKPVRNASHRRLEVFKGPPYFWETCTIHPEL